MVKLAIPARLQLTRHNLAMAVLAIVAAVSLLCAAWGYASGGPVASMELVPSPLLPIVKNTPVTLTVWWGIEAE